MRLDIEDAWAEARRHGRERLPNGMTYGQESDYDDAGDLAELARQLSQQAKAA